MRTHWFCRMDLVWGVNDKSDSKKELEQAVFVTVNLEGPLIRSISSINGRFSGRNQRSVGIRD